MCAWIALCGAFPIGMFLAAASAAGDSWVGTGGWATFGFSALVCGWLLVKHIPRMEENHSATVRSILQEHKATCEKIAEGHTEACRVIADNHDDSNKSVVDAIDRLGTKIDGYHGDSFKLTEMLAKEHIREKAEHL